MGRGPGQGIWRRAVGLAALVAGLTLTPSAQADFDCGTALIKCRVQVDNFGRAWFDSYEKLTEDSLGDGTLQHGVSQVYERVGNETLLISRMPNGDPIAPEGKWPIAASLLGVSPDGERVYMSTEATLAPQDLDGGHGDGSTDSYVLSNGSYTLLTTGPLDNGANPNPYAGDRTVWASDDGRYVYFQSAQQLVPEDWDSRSDIYQRFEGRTRLVSTGPDEYLPTPEYPDPPVAETRFLGASPDGSTAYFTTSQHLTADDPGKSPSEGWRMAPDIFAWHDGVTTRLTHSVSPQEAPGTPWEAFDPYSFAGASEEGSVYFIARSGQVREDTNQSPDIYRAKPDGTLERVIDSGLEGPDRALRVEAVSRDGSRIFLFKPRWIGTSGQVESEEAIYMWSGGTYKTLVPESRTPVKDAELALCSITGNGRRAYFQTRATLSAEDTDAEPDVYEWHEGAVRLVSPASDGRQSAAFCMGISPNGRYVAFSTWEQLIPGDNDTKQDIYIIDMGAGDSSSARVQARPMTDSPTLRAKPTSHRRHHRRLRLITAEAIAPKMGIARAGTLSEGIAHLGLGCPKAERSGPCHGRAKLINPKTHKVLAAGAFRIQAGKRASVSLKGAGLPQHSIRALARVRGADMLGNRRTVSATVKLRPPAK